LNTLEYLECGKGINLKNNVMDIRNLVTIGKQDQEICSYGQLDYQLLYQILLKATVIKNQITKSGTSIGANYRKQTDPEVRADFSNKISICGKRGQ